MAAQFVSPRAYELPTRCSSVPWALAHALLSGVLLTLSFPSVGHPALSWVALVPLVVVVARAPSAFVAWRLGLVTGVVHFAGMIYWIPSVMVTFGGLSTAVAWLIHAAFVGYLALFPSLFALALWAVGQRLGARAILWTPVFWVTSELGRLHLFTGFPWELLGYSQAEVLPVAQLASVTGVLGLSALVALVNGALAFGAVAAGRRRWCPLAVALGVVAVCVGLRMARLAAGRLLHSGTAIRVAAVQGNIAQDEKWVPERAERNLGRYLDLTEIAVDAGASLVVWPEASTPFVFELDPRAELVKALVRERRVHLLFGTTDVARPSPPGHASPAPYYNAAVMLDPRGETAGVYRKQHLVPWGEYVPLRDLLFFLSPLVTKVGGFSAGDRSATLPFDGAEIGTAICYEIIYPGLVRELAVEGSQLLTTVTNDAWFGQTAAPHQHFQMATLRAIEQGRFLVRAANTGISAVVDPYGRVLDQSPLFEEAVVVADARLLEQRTIFARTGDLTALTCGSLSALLLAFSLGRRPWSVTFASASRTSTLS